MIEFVIQTSQSTTMSSETPSPTADAMDVERHGEQMKTIEEVEEKRYTDWLQYIGGEDPLGMTTTGPLEVNPAAIDIAEEQYETVQNLRFKQLSIDLPVHGRAFDYDTDPPVGDLMLSKQAYRLVRSHLETRNPIAKGFMERNFPHLIRMVCVDLEPYEKPWIDLFHNTGSLQALEQFERQMAEVPNKVMQLFQFMNESVWNHAALDLFFSYCANDEAPLWTRWSGGCQAWIELCRFLVSALAPKLINYTVQHNPGLLQTILQNIHITKLYELLPEWLMNGEWADYLVSEPIMVQNTLRETFLQLALRPIETVDAKIETGLFNLTELMVDLLRRKPDSPVVQHLFTEDFIRTLLELGLNPNTHYFTATRCVTILIAITKSLNPTLPTTPALPEGTEENLVSVDIELPLMKVLLADDPEQGNKKPILHRIKQRLLETCDGKASVLSLLYVDFVLEAAHSRRSALEAFVQNQIVEICFNLMISKPLASPIHSSVFEICKLVFEDVELLLQFIESSEFIIGALIAAVLNEPPSWNHPTSRPFLINLARLVQQVSETSMQISQRLSSIMGWQEAVDTLNSSVIICPWPMPSELRHGSPFHTAS